MEWIVVTDASADPALAALAERGELDCRQNVFINKGDTVYLYAAEPCCVRFKCEVTEEGIAPEKAAEPTLAPVSDANNRENYPHFMRLKLLCAFPEGKLPLEGLKEHGLPNVLGSTLVRERLSAYLRAAEA